MSMERPTIILHPERTAKVPLATLTVGRASAFECEILGAPQGLQELQIHIAKAGTANYTAVVARPLSDNRWAVYASGLNFPDEGVARYHLTGKDQTDNAVWLGSGRLEIVPSVLHSDAANIPVIPEDTYVRNPATGLWHKVTMHFDGDELVMNYEKEGITR